MLKFGICTLLLENECIMVVFFFVFFSLNATIIIIGFKTGVAFLHLEVSIIVQHWFIRWTQSFVIPGEAGRKWEYQQSGEMPPNRASTAGASCSTKEQVEAVPWHAQMALLGMRYFSLPLSSSGPLVTSPKSECASSLLRNVSPLLWLLSAVP